MVATKQMISMTYTRIFAFFIFIASAVLQVANASSDQQPSCQTYPMTAEGNQALLEAVVQLKEFTTETAPSLMTELYERIQKQAIFPDKHTKEKLGECYYRAAKIHFDLSIYHSGLSLVQMAKFFLLSADYGYKTWWGGKTPMGGYNNTVHYLIAPEQCRQFLDHYPDKKNPHMRKIYHDLLVNGANDKKIIPLLLEKATPDDVEQLQKQAQILLEKDHFGDAARFYLRLNALGDETAQKAFEGLADRYSQKVKRDLWESDVSRYRQEAQDFYAVLRVHRHENPVIAQMLGRLLGKKHFAEGALAYLCAQDEPHTLTEALKFLKAHEHHIQNIPDKILNHFQVLADAGDLGACHKICELCKEDRSLLNTVKYYVKAMELGDKHAGHRLHKYLYIYSCRPSTEQVAAFLPYCFQAIDRGVPDIKETLEQQYAGHKILWRERLKYYIQKGDEASIQKALVHCENYEHDGRSATEAFAPLKIYLQEQAAQDHMMAARNLAKLCVMAGDPKEAVAWHLKALVLGDEEAPQALRSVLAKKIQYMPHISENCKEKLIALKDPDLLNQVGHTLLRSESDGRYQKAAVYFLAAIALGDRDAKGYLVKTFKGVAESVETYDASDFIDTIFPLCLDMAEEHGYLYEILADAYKAGEIVKKDLERSTSLYLQAARVLGWSLITTHQHCIQGTWPQDHDAIRKAYQAHVDEAEADEQHAIMNNLFSLDDQIVTVDISGLMLLSLSYEHSDEDRGNMYWNQAYVRDAETFFTKEIDLYLDLYTTESIRDYIAAAVNSYKELAALNVERSHQVLETLLHYPARFKRKKTQYSVFKVIDDELLTGDMNPQIYLGLSRLWREGAYEYYNFRTAALYCVEAMRIAKAETDKALAQVAMIDVVSCFKRINIKKEKRCQNARRLLAVLGAEIDNGIIWKCDHHYLCEQARHFDVLTQYYIRQAQTDEVNRQAHLEKVWDLLAVDYTVEENDVGDTISIAGDSLLVLEEEAEAGNPYALHTLGLKSLNMPQQEISYYLRAAKLGHSEALSDAYKCFLKVQHDKASRRLITPALHRFVAYYHTLEKQDNGSFHEQLVNLYTYLGHKDLACAQKAQSYYKAMMVGLVHQTEQGDQEMYKKAIAFERDFFYDSEGQQRRELIQNHWQDFISPLVAYHQTQAEAGCTTAQKEVVLSYCCGVGVNPNPQDARKQCLSYLKGMSDNPDMQKAGHTLIKSLYEFSSDQDDNVLVAFYEDAAALGFHQASFILGSMYSHNHSHLYDLDKACTYFETAVYAGHEEAKDALLSLYKQGGMTPSTPQYAETFAHLKKMKDQESLKDFFYWPRKTYDDLDEESYNAYDLYRRFQSQLYNIIMVQDSPAHQETAFAKQRKQVWDALCDLHDLNLAHWLTQPGFLMSGLCVEYELEGFLSVFALGEEEALCGCLGKEEVKVAQDLYSFVERYRKNQLVLENVIKNYEETIAKYTKEELFLASKVTQYDKICTSTKYGDVSPEIYQEKIKALKIGTQIELDVTRASCVQLEKEKDLLVDYQGVIEDLGELIRSTSRMREEGFFGDGGPYAFMQ